MNVAIIGCRDAAHLVEQIYINKANYQVICLGDNNIEIQGKFICGLKIFSIKDIAFKYHSGEIESVIITVRKGYNRYCLIQQLIGYNIKNIILIRPSVLTYHLPIVFDERASLYKKQWLTLYEYDKPIIHHLETHIANGCNLNCRGCLHFSNLFDKNDFPDMHSLLKDIKYISQKSEIFQFRILGGEPLLNPKLPIFINELRKILPNTDIAIISNGLLIPTVSEELFYAMKNNYIGFNLTLYPPTLKLKDQIYNILENYGVAYGSHVAKTDEFTRFLMRTPCTEQTDVHKQCESRGILELYNGRIHKCPLETFIYKYFEKFQLTPVELRGYDIYDNNLNWKELVAELTVAKGEFCCYCSKKIEMYTWKCGKPHLEDWLVDDSSK